MVFFFYLSLCVGPHILQDTLHAQSLFILMLTQRGAQGRPPYVCFTEDQMGSSSSMPAEGPAGDDGARKIAQGCRRIKRDRS